MAADTARSGAGEVPCPDPSVHEKHNRLSEQASTAALYVTDPAHRTTVKGDETLGKDGKLSSRSKLINGWVSGQSLTHIAGAAASLKYARLQDLPSYPIVGINQTSSAGQAAMLAKDYKMKELWQPEMSSAGSKAAQLAHRDGGKLDLWHPTASRDGNSAAGIAMRTKGLSPQLDYGYTPDGRSRALLAATMSVKAGRQRAGSNPTPVPAAYPDSANSAYNALNAATVSHRTGSVKPKQTDSNRWDSAAMQAARVQNIGGSVDREMYTEHPPVEIKQEERRHQAALHASAVSMAKQMYEYSNRATLNPDLTGRSAAETAASRAPGSAPPTDIKSEALKYIHLQDAAHKLAQERLAKVDKNFEAAKYREYYGYGDKGKGSRLSMRGRNRRRASSEGAANQDVDSSDDEMRARRIRNQMSGFNKSLADVHEKKKQTDRAALLAVAEKRVHKRMHDMDEKVFQDTGKVSQSMMDEWEAKARKKAQEDEAVRAENRGKTHIGGGKFMDRSEIEAIAQARLQPTLDEINDTAEKRRARDEEARLENAEHERQRESEKQKHKEEKDEQKKVKNEEKAAARKDKDERKAAERAEKERQKEEKRRSKEEKRKSKEVKKDEVQTAKPEFSKQAAEEAAKAENSEDHTLTNTKDNELAGSSEGATLALPTERKKPDLERHISTIDTSSEGEDGEDDDDWDNKSGRGFTALPTAAASPDDGSKDHTRTVAERAVSTPVVDEPISDIPAANDKTDEALKVADPSAPVAPTSDVVAAPSSTVKTGPDGKLDKVDEPNEKERKGLRGLFSKLRSRQSKPEGKVSEPKTSSEKSFQGGSKLTGVTSKESADPTSSIAAPSSSTPAEHIGIDGPMGDTTHITALGGEAGAASPSSVKRGGADLGDVSSLSSSGHEEADIERGRTGLLGRTLGFGKGKDEDVAGETENLAEARDHFDETLAPPPAFAGQAKSESPARQTKFSEEL